MCGASRSDSAWWAEAQRLAAEQEAREVEARELAELEAVIEAGKADVDRILAEVQDRHPAFVR